MTEPFTVVMDWDSSQEGRDAVAFRVMAESVMEARVVADSAAWDEYGDDADYLYGVMIFKGHPERAE